jgi:ubiquinone/menaquinone biosynthesis C-methylase UbiE
MKAEVQKSIWDREQVDRIRSGDDKNKRRLDRIFKKILRLSGRNSPADYSVLNVGIGNGLFETMLVEAGFQAYSLDPSENAIRAVAEKLGVAPARFQVGSCASMPFPDRSFNYVVMSEVIEHLDDPTLTSTMAELRRVLKPGGHFIGTCPDNEDVIAKTQTCPYCNASFHRVGHVRSFTKDSLRARLAQDFDVQECCSFRGISLNWKGLVVYWYNTLPYRIGHLFKSTVTIPQSMGRTLFFVAKAMPE